MCVLASATVAAEEFKISAQVDRTTLTIGESLTLTITMEGDLAKATIDPVKFPNGWEVLAQSRASNISLRLGNASRSTSLVYVLRAGEPGTFDIGPFQVHHRGKAFLTDAIEVVVSKPAVPPTLKHHERLTL